MEIIKCGKNKKDEKFALRHSLLKKQLSSLYPAAFGNIDLNISFRTVSGS